MIKQLEFEKKITLIREIISENGNRMEFYEYSEGLAKKYGILRVSDEELDKFLHINGHDLSITTKHENK